MKFSEYLINEKFLTGDNLRARFGGYDDPLAYINIHVNPDHSEVLAIIEDFKQTSPKVYRDADVKDFVRGFFDQKGNLYVWYGAFFHDSVERFLMRQEGTRGISKNERFRFAWIKGDDALTTEGSESSIYFRDMTDKAKKKNMTDKLIKAFPMIKTEDEDGNQDVNTQWGDKAWVGAMSTNDNTKSSSSKSSDKSEPTKKPEPVGKTDIIKSLYKMGDTIVFTDDSPPAERGKEVKILAIARTASGYYYIYKARKGDSPTYDAQKFLDPEYKIEFIDGKFNVKKANEPFAVIKHNGSYIKKIIPDPERLKRLGNNLYEPRNVVSRGYTNPDRMEVKENIK